MMTINQDGKKGTSPRDRFMAARLPQDYSGGVQEHAASLPLRKPTKMEFFRTRRGPEWTMQLGVVEDEQKSQYAVLDRSLYLDLEGVMKPCQLVLCANRHGNHFVWASPMVTSDRPNQWHVTAAEARDRSFDTWTRMVADTTAGRYRIYAPVVGGPLDRIEPEWPSEDQFTDFLDVLVVAFGDRLIDSANHPIIDALRGSR